MNLRSHRPIHLLLATVALGASTIACSGGAGEKTQATDEAWLSTKSDTVLPGTFNSAMSIFQVSQTTFQMTSNHGVLTPSPFLQSFMGLQPTTFDFTPVHMSPPSPVPDGTVSAESVNVSGLSITLDGNNIVASVVVSADLWYTTDHFYTPDAGVRIDPSNVVVRFAVDGNGGLVVTDVQADLHYYAHDCGLAGWCSGLVDSFLPDLGAIVASNAKSLLGAQKISIDGAWNQLLTAYANGGLFSSPSTWTWTVMGSTETISNAMISYQSQRNEAPPAPICKVYWDCNSSSSYVTCSNWLGDAQVYRQTKTGEWVDFATTKYSPSSPLMTDNFYVCASDSDGTTCGAVFTEAVSAYPQTGACPKGPPKGKPKPICHWTSTGLLVCDKGTPPPGTDITR